MIKQADSSVAVIGSNENEFTPYRIVCDEWYREPVLGEDEYVDFCLSFCREHSIGIFMPRRNFLAISRRRQEFSDIGVKLMVDPYELIYPLNCKSEAYRLLADCPEIEIPEHRIVTNAAQFAQAYGELKEHFDKVCFKFEEDEGGFLERLAAPEWGEDAKTMAGIWRDLTDAYSEYPLSNDMQYYGPFHAGIAWPLYARVEMKPLGRTWKPQDVTSGDAIGECLENHTLEEAAMLASRMRRGVAGLAPALSRLSAKYAGDRDRLLDLGVAKALVLLFESASDIFDFYLHRARAISASRLHGDSRTALGELALMRTAARDAMRTTEEMLPLARADARLGFHSEAESHQFHPAKLEWRLAMLRQTLADIDEIEAALRCGEPYPKSEHEAKAPTMRCGEWTEVSRAFKAIRRTDSELDVLLDGTWATTDRHFRFRPSFADNGDVVLEGEIPDLGPITVLTLDACGATWSRALAFGLHGKVSHPSQNVVTTTHEVRSLTTARKGGGWTFRLVLDASGWGGDKAKRPAWLRVRRGETPIWPELNPAPEARLNIGNVTPDLFGRIEPPAPKKSPSF